MNIAVLNVGSGSQKLALFELDTPLPLEPRKPAWSAHINATSPDQPEDSLWIELTDCHGRRRDTISKEATFAEKVERLLTLLQEALSGRTLHAIAHRVVHGGGKYTAAVPVTADVEKDIETFAVFAPLHNHDNLAGIRIARRCFADTVPSYAIFDTAFHHTLPEAAYVYAGPYQWLQQGVRRYGFHGSSFRWACHRAAGLLGRKEDSRLKLIICHLGGGCSLAATVGGRCIDTTMGLTPLDGVAMCTRSGAVDPGVLLHLLRQGVSLDELEKILNKDSGLKGLSGLPGDTRIIRARADAGDQHAKRALEVFTHRLAAGFGQMLAALCDRPDAIVFTDVIGESEPLIRADLCGAFAHLGIVLDEEKNTASPIDANISAKESDVSVLIVHCEEEWQIATECLHSIEGGCMS